MLGIQSVVYGPMINDQDAAQAKGETVRLNTFYSTQCIRKKNVFKYT